LTHITFICTVIEDVESIDSRRTLLLVAKDEINPFMKMTWYILGLLHT